MGIFWRWFGLWFLKKNLFHQRSLCTMADFFCEFTVTLKYNKQRVKQKSVITYIFFHCRTFYQPFIRFSRSSFSSRGSWRKNFCLNRRMEPRVKRYIWISAVMIEIVLVLNYLVLICKYVHLIEWYPGWRAIELTIAKVANTRARNFAIIIYLILPRWSI